MAINTLVGRAAILAAAVPLFAAPVRAQDAAPPSAEQQQHAVEYLRVLIGALQSETIEEPVKSALVSCIYGNSLRTISEAMDKAITDAPETFDRANPSHLLGMMARVCGYRPDADADADADTDTPPPGR